MLPYNPPYFGIDWNESRKSALVTFGMRKELTSVPKQQELLVSAMQVQVLTCYKAMPVQESSVVVLSLSMIFLTTLYTLE